MFTLVLVATLSLATAAPQDITTTPVAIVRSAADGPNPDGSYSWSYETADGTKAEESGSIRQVEQRSEGEGGEALVARGAYSFTAPDGTTYTVTYTADENGYQPQGEHLPQAPAVPEGIVRALKYIAEHPEENNIDEQKPKN